jgi:NAD(P)-dependent dehydrogenase (short-subunit alcohol dehydrogenase family)
MSSRPWEGAVWVVTGGGSGIGEAVVTHFAAMGSRVVVADIDLKAAERVANKCGGIPIQCDVSREEDVKHLVVTTIARFGKIDVFFSNAGIHFGGIGGMGAEAHSASQWEKIWKVNVQSHVFAIQALLPHFRTQKKGTFIVTASAAGLLSQIGDVSYSTTKHAAVGLAEAIAIAHSDEGVRVLCLCPQAVDTPMIRPPSDSPVTTFVNPAAVDGVVTPEEVAKCVDAAIQKGTFLILPHPKVTQYIQNKAADYDRWIAGMRRWRRSML